MRSGVRKLLVALVAAVMALGFAPLTYASAPGPNGGPNTRGSAKPDPLILQDPAWVAKKQAHQVRSGIKQGQGKGSSAQPYIATLAPNIIYPSSYMLSDVNPVPNTFEPSDGNYSNYGSGTSLTDDANRPYNDHDFFNLCGPGAADNALWHWPSPPNRMDNSSVTDTAHTSTTTTWNGTDKDGVARTHGYMTFLAWQTQWPGWTHPGMMDNSTYYSYGTTL
jgi:hypothetical protein